MKHKRLIRIILINIIVMLLSFKLVNADVGSFDRYDSGGSDWSSSSSDWDWGSDSSDSWSSSSSGWDWGSDSSSSWSSWDDNDHSYSGSGSRGNSRSGGFLLGLLLGSTEGRGILIIAIVLIIAASYTKRKWNREMNGNFYIPRYKNTNTVYTTNVHDVPRTHICAEQVKKIDPLFSEEKFLSWAKDLYVKMQHAWTERNWEEMRYFETEELFEQHSAQVQGYIENNTINVIDRISVNYATIYGFRQTAEKDIIQVALKATKKDYIIDADTKDVVEGNKYQDRITVYKMTFERTKGKLTQEGTDTLDAKNCPNCGAPLNITSSGKCEYCGSIVTTGVHDWVLSGLEPLTR